MKRWLALCVLLIGNMAVSQRFYHDDVDRFWIAYQKIVGEKDSIRQLEILNSEYISKGSPGLSALFKARNYTDRELLKAILSYPKYWESIRSDSRSSRDFETDIVLALAKLKGLYPELGPVDVYFSVGAFRCNGTGVDGKVLIGAEMALTGPEADLSQMPDWILPYFLEMKPRKHLPLLCTHECVHTQQHRLVENLLCASLYEGIAEFVACKATGLESNIPAFALWNQRSEEILKQFQADLFNPDHFYHWLWGQNPNALQARDLGYVVGFKIAQSYWEKSKDKRQAIQELIELDYANDQAVETIVDASGLLDKTVAELNQSYEASRPTVISIFPLEKTKVLKPGLHRFTIAFSEPLNGYNTGLDFGPLGETHSIKVKRVIGWGDDKKTWTFEAELEPERDYQLLISNNFRLDSGVRLKPYLIQLSTSR